MAPLKNGTNLIELCFDHFEPPDRLTAANPQPAFILHIGAVSTEDRTAAFALLPAAPGHAPQYFTARWGRTGVGATNFMPVPAQVEDDRPSLTVYGHRSYSFNWRNTQWEVAQILPSLDLPALSGDTLEVAANVIGAYALRDGLPLANTDTLPFGKDEASGVVKEEEHERRDHGESYRVRFGGRIWRRWLDRGHGEGDPLELLAFDTESIVAQGQLDDVWDDIGGQEEAKRELVRAIQWPVLYPELFLLFKRRRSRGVLLYGPPGCGKTLLGKAVVRLLASLYNRRAEDGGFKYVKGHTLLDQYVGNSEKAVKALFDEARRWREQRGYPAVLFFDEADALFKRRPANAAEAVFTMVPALLAEMDGMDESAAFVILATNRPDALDPAITRPGRIDRRIRVTRPNEEATRRIFAIHLDGVFLDDGVTLDGLSALAAAEMFSPSHLLYELGVDGAKVPFLLKDLASGALIQNVVDRATANKMDYCIEHGVKKGLTEDDIRVAVGEVLAEQRESRHSEEIEQFLEARSGRGLTPAASPEDTA